MTEYIPIIGLEIHIQLKTKSKMFCGCDNKGEDQEPNTTICPICLGYPGVLPVINKEAVEMAILMGLALNGRVLEMTKFDRKNYFYPDLPKGYQISQFDQPLVEGGWLEIKSKRIDADSDADKRGSIRASKRIDADSDAERRGSISENSRENSSRLARIRITRVHLEEDAAKMIHLQDEKYSLIDFNRAGTPLLEIVTEPDFRSPQEAKLFLQEMRLIARYLGISDADMEKGHLRCDANISLIPCELECELYANENANKKTSSKRGGVIGKQMTLDQFSHTREYGEIGAILKTPNVDTSKLNAKTEIKNLNSFKAVERALEYEIKRQTRLWEEGNPPKEQSTRGWDENKGITVEQRIKEESHDYRYFPEPDLPPIKCQMSNVKCQNSGIDLDRLRQRMRELPQAKRLRFIRQYGFSPEEARILTEDRDLSYYTEKVISELKAWLISLEEVEGSEQEIWKKNKKKLVKMVANWLINKLGGLIAKENLDIKNLKITPENFAEFTTLIYQNKISSLLGQKILERMFKTGGDPSQIIAEENLEQVSDKSELGGIIDEVIKNNPKIIEDYKKGKKNVLQFLVGQIMKESKGKANPGVANELLRKKLI